MPKNTFTDYEGFVEKFKPKKTTDDCYTPEWLYNLVVDYIDKCVHPLAGLNIVRPFYPGGDYERVDYKPDDVVIDNPPFSIISAIVNFYLSRGVRFWLWAPGLTLGGLVKDKPCAAVVTRASITYANGAIVNTGFVTNLYPGDPRIVVAGTLDRLLSEGENGASNGKMLPRYELPDGVVSSALLQRIAAAGIDLRVEGSECRFTRGLDSQKAAGKDLFGGGWLLSREAAAREAAAREAAAMEAAGGRTIHWLLSEQEKAVMDSLTTPAEIYQIPKYVPDPLNVMVANPPFAAPTIKPEHPSLFDELTLGQ